MKIKNLYFLLGLACTSPLFAQTDNLYQKYAPEAERIYQQMSVEERIGQLIMPSYAILATSVSTNGEACHDILQNPNASRNQIVQNCGLNQIKQFHIGAVLTGGGPYYNAPTLQNWASLNSLSQEQHKLGSPKDPILLTGNDTIHGNMHVQGAVIFPHTIGLGVTHDAKLIEQIGLLVGQDSLASGFNWDYIPVVAAAQDLRWGRTYESFGQDSQLTKILGTAYIEGFQNIQRQKITGTVATVKHFLGDGATQYGLDEGDDNFKGDQASFWLQNGSGYEGAVEANVGSMMVSYSAINGDNTRMHFGDNWDIINQFKNVGIVGSQQKTYRLNGFVVSDWNGPVRAAYFYNQANHTELTLPQILAKSVNAGIDVLMLSSGALVNPFDANSPAYFTNVEQIFNAMMTAYQQKLISEQRLKDAVIRILSVKLAMSPQLASSYPVLQKKERDLALQAAHESIVLLKNQQNLIPVNSNTLKNVIFIGDTNDLGLQNGGWTINWQGQKGSQYFTGVDKLSSGALTLEEAIKLKLKNTVHYYHLNDLSNNNLNSKNTIAIVAIAEPPYAEYMGDIGNPYEEDLWYNNGAKNGENSYMSLPQSQFLGLTFSSQQANTINALKENHIPIITVVYSGRPVILTQGNSTAPLNNSNAVIAAFLPGTLGGQALTDAIFGNYHFRANGKSNTLTFPWPRDMNDVENHFATGNLFPIGYGLKS